MHGHPGCPSPASCGVAPPRPNGSRTPGAAPPPARAGRRAAEPPPPAPRPGRAARRTPRRPSRSRHKPSPGAGRKIYTGAGRKIYTRRKIYTPHRFAPKVRPAAVAAASPRAPEPEAPEGARGGPRRRGGRTAAQAGASGGCPPPRAPRGEGRGRRELGAGCLGCGPRSAARHVHGYWSSVLVASVHHTPGVCVSHTLSPHGTLIKSTAVQPGTHPGGLPGPHSFIMVPPSLK